MALWANVAARYALASTTYTDDSGNGNHLTQVNTPVAAAGFDDSSNTATDFERASSQRLYITDASQTGLDITGNLAIAARVRLESNEAGEFHMIVSKYTSSQFSYDLHIRPDGYVGFRVSDDGTAVTSATSTTAITINTWYSIVAIYDGSNVQIYINNGAAEGATAHTTGIYNSNADFMIGAVNDGGLTHHFDGRISDVVVWSQTLTSGERTHLYNLLEDFTIDGEINGTVRDWVGAVVNCSTYNTRVNVYPKNNTVSSPIDSQLITSANGTFSMGGLVEGTEYKVDAEYEGTYQGQVDLAGAVFVTATQA
jgi:hypothetical protein